MAFYSHDTKERAPLCLQLANVSVLVSKRVHKPGSGQKRLRESPGGQNAATYTVDTASRASHCASVFLVRRQVTKVRPW